MKRQTIMVILVLVTFFVISFLTNILGAINPNAQHDFNLSLSLVGFLPFSIFLAYGVMSIPAGYSGRKVHRKTCDDRCFYPGICSCINFCLCTRDSVFSLVLFSPSDWDLPCCR